MHPGFWGLAAVTIPLLSAGWMALLGRMWVLRNTFEMVARAPVLVISTGVATFVTAVSVMLHWALLFDGLGLPCYLIFWSSYSCERVGLDLLRMRGFKRYSTFFCNIVFHHWWFFPCAAFRPACLPAFRRFSVTPKFFLSCGT